MKKIISMIATFILLVSTTAFADTNTYKLTLKAENASILEQDNIDYIEVLLQEGDNVTVVYLEKSNNWSATEELKEGEYKIKVTNIPQGKYLIKNEYSVKMDKDKSTEILLDNFEIKGNNYDEKKAEEVKEKSQEVEEKPVKEKDMEQHQTTSQNLKTRSIKIAMTVILCTLAAAIILIILWFISKIID